MHCYVLDYYCVCFWSLKVAKTWTCITFRIRFSLNHCIYRFIGKDIPNDGRPEREIFTLESMTTKLQRLNGQISQLQRLPLKQLTFQNSLIPIIQISVYVIFFSSFSSFWSSESSATTQTALICY